MGRRSCRWRRLTSGASELQGALMPNLGSFFAFRRIEKADILIQAPIAAPVGGQAIFATK